MNTAPNAKMVRRMEREYAAALRREEAADDLAMAWRLAAASDRALARLKDARAGIVRQPPRTARNLAHGAYAALAGIGKAIARALTTAAALRKAQAAAKAARAARAAVRLVYRSLRRAVAAVATLATATTKEIAVKIQRIRIVGTKIVTFSAWEVDHGNHSTITHIDGVRYGKVGTTNITAELNALPAMSDERSRAVRAYIEADKQRAYAAILAECPEAREGRPDGMGEIEIIVA